MIKEIAKKLDGNNLDRRLDSGDIDLQGMGFVIVYGQSDDLLELDGAIRDEYGAYNGTQIKLNSKGVIENLCESEDCPYYLKEEREAKFYISAEFDPSSIDATWLITSNIPHETFNIMEDDELFCKGIIFDIRSLQEK